MPKPDEKPKHLVTARTTRPTGRYRAGEHFTRGPREVELGDKGLRMLEDDPEIVVMEVRNIKEAKKDPPEDPSKLPEGHELRIEAIVKALGKLKKEDFGNDGVPNTSIVSKAAGFTVKADERDKALEQFKKGK